jgi:hypothetical protein
MYAHPSCSTFDVPMSETVNAEVTGSVVVYEYVLSDSIYTFNNG